MRRPGLRLEVSLYLHATEDEEKVMRSVEEALGIPRSDFYVSRASGHYGNPVTIFRAILEGERALEALGRLVARMDEGERRALGHYAREAVDERGRVYIRLDKQGLVLGKVRIGRRDPVELVISSPRRDEPLSELMRLLGDLE